MLGLATSLKTWKSHCSETCVCRSLTMNSAFNLLQIPEAPQLGTSSSSDARTGGGLCQSYITHTHKTSGAWPPEPDVWGGRWVMWLRLDPRACGSDRCCWAWLWSSGAVFNLWSEEQKTCWGSADELWRLWICPGGSLWRCPQREPLGCKEYTIFKITLLTKQKKLVCIMTSSLQTIRCVFLGVMQLSITKY